uniref:Uncharacterized protein n=1 Tax=Melopsittacus undulatus TaxID=13146 RepID=A0A8C6NCU9_MELUD
ISKFVNVTSICRLLCCPLLSPCHLLLLRLSLPLLSYQLLFPSHSQLFFMFVSVLQSTILLLHCDFLCISLVNGFIQLRYNLGDKTVTLQTFQKVCTNGSTWHSLKAGRAGNEGYLDLDGVNITHKASPGMNALDTHTDFFVGGVSSLNLVNSMAVENEPTGFTGCIREVVINNRELKLTVNDPTGGANVGDCDGTACGYTVCKNNGTCQALCIPQPTLFSYSCMYLQYSRISLNFTTNQSEGLIVWMGKGEDEDNDFLAIGLANGTLKVVINLGERISVPLIHSNYSSCCDEKWHFVTVVQNQTCIKVYLDEELILFEDIDPHRKYTALNYGGICYFGGFEIGREVNTVTTGLFHKEFTYKANHHSSINCLLLYEQTTYLFLQNSYIPLE